jgi:hypothetical protein
VVTDLPLDRGELVVAHHDQALEAPDKFGGDAGAGEQHADVRLGGLVVKPGEAPSPGPRVQTRGLVEDDERDGQRLPRLGRQGGHHQL